MELQIWHWLHYIIITCICITQNSIEIIIFIIRNKNMDLPIYWAITWLNFTITDNCSTKIIGLLPSVFNNSWSRCTWIINFARTIFVNNKSILSRCTWAPVLNQLSIINLKSSYLSCLHIKCGSIHNQSIRILSYNFWHFHPLIRTVGNCF